MSHFLILIPLSFLLVCEVYSELLEYQNFGLVTSQEGDYNRDGEDEPGSEGELEDGGRKVDGSGGSDKRHCNDQNGSCLY